MEQTPLSSYAASIFRQLPFARPLYGWIKKRRRWRRFVRDYQTFSQMVTGPPTRFCLRWEDRYPCLNDNASDVAFDHHYIYHTAWAARRVAEIRPLVHIDISSSLYFSALVSAFVPIKFYDYRPVDLRLSQLTADCADLTNLVFETASIQSLSCMHVVEHIGLGRYGDALNPNNDLKAISELKRVLAPGGSLLFVVPVGQPKIMFNAHRIYAVAQILDAFADLQLSQFALITDNLHNGLIENAPLELADRQKYGCGCFWFQRQG